jgi:adenylate kinase
MKAHALVFLGGPGAGKGTQAARMAKEFGIPHISTGEILRKAAADGTPLGLAAKARMDQGELVPDDVVCGIVLDRISLPDCRNGFILDGFPRTIGQAISLDEHLEQEGRKELLVINLRVEPEVLVKRLTARRTCPVCGRTYNMCFAPPRRDEVCDVDGAKLVRRADDNEEAIRHRLAAYERETAPLIDYYRGKSVLHEVDGSHASETVAKDLSAFLVGA